MLEKVSRAPHDFRKQSFGQAKGLLLTRQRIPSDCQKEPNRNAKGFLPRPDLKNPKSAARLRSIPPPPSPQDESGMGRGADCRTGFREKAFKRRRGNIMTHKKPPPRGQNELFKVKYLCVWLFFLHHFSLFQKLFSFAHTIGRGEKTAMPAANFGRRRGAARIGADGYNINKVRPARTDDEAWARG